MKSLRPVRRLTRALSRLIATACIIALLSAAGGKIEANARPTEDDFKAITVFFVRHAEKGTTPTSDPPLTEAGKARAQVLARILESAGIKAIFTSNLVRTKQTAEPLAQKIGVPIQEVRLEMMPSPSTDVTQGYIDAMAGKILEQSGEAVLVVGHTNTVPQIIKKLGAEMAPTIRETEFDNLYVVTVYARNKVKVARLKYGS